MAKFDVEIKKPVSDVDEVRPKKAERPVEKRVSQPKKVIGYRITKKDGKVVKSEPIYS